LEGFVSRGPPFWFGKERPDGKGGVKGGKRKRYPNEREPKTERKGKPAQGGRGPCQKK